jgi:hypothetical protein
MKFGLYMPNYGKILGYANNLADLANRAEECGWDGFFIFDHILAEKPTKNPMVDPWIALSAIAMKTEKIKFGTTVTPLPRRRPWKLARETVTLDHLSKGRLILSIGLGTPADVEYGSFGEETNAKIRAEKLDEGLDILLGLWEGKDFSYYGKHFKIDQVKFLPKPFQEPRIKIWGSGFWPNKLPFIRSARLDGVFPLSTSTYGKLTDNDFKTMHDFIFEHRDLKTPFDMVKLSGITDKKTIEKYEQVGVTWGLTYIGASTKLEIIHQRIDRGPPT